jgi:teichuronic acid biosynthesis glycosyltransferase TuaC
MKVLIVTNLYPSDDRPTWGTFVKEQVESLREFCPDLILDVFVIHSYRSDWEYLRAMRLLPGIIRRNEYDLVHAHFGLTLVSMLFIPTPPLVVTFHGSDILVSPAKYVSRLLAKKASRAIVVADKMRDELGYGDVIPCGIDVKTFSTPSDWSQKPGCADHRPCRILFPADPRNRIKGYGLFHTACLELKKKGYEVEEVHLVNVSREKVPEVYWNCDVMLLTSLSEGSPTVVKEAIAAKLPFVSVDVGDVSQWVKLIDFGEVVADRKPERIADAVSALLARTGDRALFDNSRCIETIDLKSVATRVKSLYDELLKDRRQASTGTSRKVPVVSCRFSTERKRAGERETRKERDAEIRSMDVSSRIRNLISFSVRALPQMILPSSLFCYERIKGRRSPRGVSVRYSLMVLLGLTRAMEAGHSTTLAVDKIFRAVLSQRVQEFGVGDLGLCLWVDSQLKGENNGSLLQKLRAKIDAQGGWDTCLGMEMAWAIAGAVSAARRSGSASAVALLKEGVASACGYHLASSDLLYHFGRSVSKRSRFPNFATQIYNVHALSCAAQMLEDDRPLKVARGIADKLLALQLPDGGWPWLYDARRGSVVERYEIYSVHQDAMAPMALLKLSEVCGDPKYARAALIGLEWLYSNNELHCHMIDEEEGLILRSIRRREPLSKVMLGVNTGLAILGAPGDAGKGWFLEINPTCRPYGLGWVLFAWSGRENFFDRMAL